MGTIAVEAAPPKFPSMFMIPVAAPACTPETLIAADQNAPSVNWTKPTLNAKPAMAIYGLRTPALRKRKIAERLKPVIAMARHPHRRPTRAESQSHSTPPVTVRTLETMKGRLAKIPPREY